MDNSLIVIANIARRSGIKALTKGQKTAARKEILAKLGIYTDKKIVNKKLKKLLHRLAKAS